MTGDGPKFVFLTIWDHFEPFLPSINSMLLVSCQNSTLKLTQLNCPGLCTMGIAYNAINAACIIGIVRQCQICSYQPGITSGFSQKSHTFGIVRQCHICSLHNWHCLTMPNMLIPAWYYKWVFAEVAHIWHCQTMPFMQLA